MSGDPDLDGTEVRIPLCEAFGFAAGGGEREFDGGKAQGKGKGGLRGGWREE